jgi:TPR repeat protein
MRTIIILGFMLLSLCGYAAEKTSASKSGLPICLEKIFKISDNKCVTCIFLDLMFFEYAFDEGCSKEEYKEVFDYYLKLAEKGDSRAQYNAGRMYAEAFVVKKDYKKAFDWILKSAEQGYDEAQFYIAQLYDHEEKIGSTNIEKNNETALKWYLKAAEQGNIKAQRILANAYRYGGGFYHSLGVEKDEKRAFDWYLKLAKQGDADAQKKIGDYYFIGEVVEKNNKEAFNYYLKSAKQDNKSAKESLATMYEHGWGTKQNCKEAIKYHAEADNSYSLGKYYDNGLCEKRNYEKAFNYYLSAFVWGYCDNHGICSSDMEGARHAIAILIEEDINKAYKIIKEEEKEYEDSRYDYRCRSIREQIEKRLNSSGK